ncbi:MAG TPA: 30S ribosomal protein S6 [Candidatus Paceibacterota bacterium]|nr:30S ribosomal protein S6 [Candidatus Paceibacterota bacterium]
MAKNMDEEVRADASFEDVGDEPRVYELGFHVDPELPMEEVKKAYQAVRESIAGKGTVIAEGEPEKIQLAYTISRQDVAGRRDFDSAYFSWIAYEATPAGHAEIVAAAGADTHLIRFIDVLTTKDAARHAVEMHELRMKAPEHTESPEEAAGAELDAALENVVV